MSSVDLTPLRLPESPPAMPPRPLGLRLLGAAALALVLLVGATFVWPLLRPVRSVPTARIEAAAAAGPTATAIAEAAGWIEPDPFPILVRPLVTGRIEQVPLLEGAEVQAGVTVLATLASASVLAQSERAAAVLVERERDLAAAEARRRQAAEQFAQRAGLRTAVAAAAADVAAKEARQASAEGMQERTAAEERGALAAVDAQRRLEQAGGANEVARQRAEAAVEAAAASRRAASREAEQAARELAAARQALAIAEEALANPVELAGNLAVAEAEVARARAARDAAAVEVQIAGRERDWLTVRAPASGVVLKVLAGPGSVVGPEGEPIMSLYDPRRVRARIDVPLGAVGGIREGQRVELRSEVLGSAVVRGRVQRLQHESDLLKNTLQVKVEVIDPPALLRPETLCRARFLADEATGRPAGRPAFRVPKAAVQAGRVFVFDPEAGLARGVAILVVSEDDAGVVVHGELSVAQRVILAPVRDGERVQEQQR